MPTFSRHACRCVREPVASAMSRVELLEDDGRAAIDEEVWQQPVAAGQMRGLFQRFEIPIVKRHPEAPLQSGQACPAFEPGAVPLRRTHVLQNKIGGYDV